MLVQVLESNRRQVVDELERRARLQTPPRAARRAQWNALVDDLVRALEGGLVDDPWPTTPGGADASRERSDRELVRSYLVEVAGRHDLEASPAEMTVVGDWCCSADRRALLDVNRHLGALLDGIDESAVTLAPDGRAVVSFASNDYLGLATHPALKAAAIQAVEKYGAGAGASRLDCGTNRL